MDIDERNVTIIEIRLKEIREKIGFTQKMVSDKMHISRSLLSVWENGYANISLKQLILIASIYKVPIDYILGIIDKEDDYHYLYINKMNLAYIGTKLREIRKKEKLTQERFAKKIDTKRSNISYYETGKMMISTADLKQICETFGVSADYITGNTKKFIMREKKEKIKPKEIKEVVKI